MYALAEQLSQYCTLFAAIPLREVENLLERHTYGMRQYPPHAFIARQGETCQSLYIVCQGAVNATMTNKEGKQMVVEQFADWAVLAPAFLFATTNRYPVNIETVTTTEILVISRATLTAMLHDSPIMMENYMREISDKLAGLTQRFKEMTLASLRDRVLHYLRSRKHYGKQQEIADRFGVARPSLNRVLQGLVAEGLIRIEHGKIILIPSAHFPSAH